MDIYIDMSCVNSVYIMYVVHNRKVELYDMSWVLRDGLRDSLVAAAPYGGPIG